MDEAYQMSQFSTMSGKRPYYKKSIIVMLLAGIVGLILTIAEGIEKLCKSR
jgi:uncharacterized membrane protein (UPF0136 family)